MGDAKYREAGSCGGVGRRKEGLGETSVKKERERWGTVTDGERAVSRV
jgi:hypothetical protein